MLHLSISAVESLCSIILFFQKTHSSCIDICRWPFDIAFKFDSSKIANQSICLETIVRKNQTFHIHGIETLITDEYGTITTETNKKPKNKK